MKDYIQDEILRIRLDYEVIRMSRLSFFAMPTKNFKPCDRVCRKNIFIRFVSSSKMFNFGVNSKPDIYE